MYSPWRSLGLESSFSSLQLFLLSSFFVRTCCPISLRLPIHFPLLLYFVPSSPFLQLSYESAFLLLFIFFICLTFPFPLSCSNLTCLTFLPLLSRLHAPLYPQLPVTKDAVVKLGTQQPDKELSRPGFNLATFKGVLLPIRRGCFYALHQNGTRD